MKNLTLRAAADACGGVLYASEEQAELEIMDVVQDSRQAQEGTLFIAIRGENVDGHRFIPDVLAKGAFVVSEQEIPEAAGPYILAESSTQALRDIAEYYRKTLTIPIVGIAGSVGKTSTKEMVASVLSQKYNVLKTEGNFNNDIGMPLTILRIREEHEAAVIEMGISDFGEMHVLAQIARPDVCVMTNIGQCHLEFLHDRDGILRAKSEIFDFLGEDDAVVLNGNDDKLSGVAPIPAKYAAGSYTEPAAAGAVIRPDRYFVNDGTAEMTLKPEEYLVRAEQITSCGLAGMEADLVFADRTIHITEPMPGMHNIYNACAGACVGVRLGLTDEQIAAGIACAQTIAGRSNMIRLRDGITLIDDCYNANPVSMEASLDVLALAEDRKIAVLGDMGELGADERAMHARVGAYAGAKGIDVLLLCGELSQEMAKAAEGCGTVRHFPDKASLIEALAEMIRPKDSILVKASHFMGYTEIVNAISERFA